jgi:hypothetical protein
MLKTDLLIITRPAGNRLAGDGDFTGGIAGKPDACKVFVYSI